MQCDHEYVSVIVVVITFMCPLLVDMAVIIRSSRNDLLVNPSRMNRRVGTII